ncbi:hypothetical protein FCOIX_11415 [Fusarium coicis]|nr:hypothetical protein FCOIX_11415 [Fusarium coicis]
MHLARLVVPSRPPASRNVGGRAREAGFVSNQTPVLTQFGLPECLVLAPTQVKPGATTAVKWLLRQGADPDETLPEAFLMSMREAPLALAFRRGQGRFQNWITCRSILFFLLEAGRFIECPACFGSGLMKFSLYIPTADPLLQDGLSRRSSCSETLYSYWEERGGRDQVTRLEEFHVFKVNAKDYSDPDVYTDDTGEGEVEPSAAVEQHPSEEQMTRSWSIWVSPYQAGRRPGSTTRESSSTTSRPFDMANQLFQQLMRYVTAQTDNANCYHPTWPQAIRLTSDTKSTASSDTE